jgi:hypothetical protein
MGSYKLIEYFSEGDMWELFDLAKDPRELHNVYSRPEYAGTVGLLKAELRKLQRAYSDV